MIARPARRCVVLVVVLALGGCLALPIPAHYVTPRRNIGDSVPAFIVPGTTTRADVLMTLGQPEFVSGDRSEFVYLVVRSRAGVWMTYGGHESTRARVEFRELDLDFDDRATVATATVATGLCVDELEATTCGRIVFAQDVKPRISDWPQDIE